MAGYSIMGVVNVTPDSFFDGGEHDTPQAAVSHAQLLIDAGATIVDVGGESTRPGAPAVSAEEEIARVEPVVAGIAQTRPDALISIDTSKLAVAERAVAAGAGYVNDVTAFTAEPELAEFVADAGTDCCLMHMQGQPRTMQQNPQYDDVVDDVRAYLEERLAFSVEHGVSEEKVQLDPGIGFGKTLDHNLELLARLDEICSIGRPVVIGVSRKSFIAKVAESRETTGSEVEDRLPGTIAAHTMALERGAKVFRVHDVAEAAQALAVADAVRHRMRVAAD